MNIFKNKNTKQESLLSQKEASDLLKSAGKLGEDITSRYFTSRTKSIGYFISIEKEWFQLDVDYFNQANIYNDFSGGIKRHYKKIEQSFLKEQASLKILNTLKDAFNIPDKEPLLIQIQNSKIIQENNLCITGQGIHTDGHDEAMILCLKRENIKGCYNSIYEDLEGKKTSLSPVLLEVGKALFWRDNKVYHHVSSGEQQNIKKEANRSVLIAHYPTTFTLNGKRNKNNNLFTNMVKKELKLRLKENDLNTII